VFTALYEPKLFLYYFSKFSRQPSPRIIFKTSAKTQLSSASLKFGLNVAVQTQNLRHLLSFFHLLQAADSPIHFSTTYLASSCLHQKDDRALPVCLDSSKLFWFLCSSNNRPYGRVFADACYRRDPISILDKCKRDLW
jgi:hypothetical protein